MQGITVTVQRKWKYDPLLQNHALAAASNKDNKMYEFDTNSIKLFKFFILFTWFYVVG